MAPPTVRDVLSADILNVAVLLRFRKCGQELNKPKIHVHATALFMWLDIVDQIFQKSNDLLTMGRLFYEAEAVLSCLKQDDGQSVQAAIPIITSMTRNRFNIHFFNNNKDEMMRNLVRILDDGVGKIVLNDNLAEFFMMYREDPSCSSLPSGVPALPEKLSRLFRPAAAVIDEAHVSVQRKVQARSMYITILKEWPITKDQIVAYFTERWGDCIDQVLRKRPGIGNPLNIEAMMIMFKSDAYIGLALNGNDIIKYQITGSQLRARRFSGRFFGLADSRFLVVP